jgi:hypothetical protein
MAGRPAPPVQPGDAGPSDQLAQLSSLRRTDHFFYAIVVRGSPTRSTRPTSMNQFAQGNLSATRSEIVPSERPMAKLNVCIRQKQPLECLDLVVRDRLETATIGRPLCYRLAAISGKVRIGLHTFFGARSHRPVWHRRLYSWLLPALVARPSVPPSLYAESHASP